MARKKRRRASPREISASGEAVRGSEGDQEGLEASFFQDETPAEDRSCLIHPGFDLNASCSACQNAICDMCSVPFGGKVLCAECFAEAAEEHRGAGGNWRGFLSFALGVLGAVLVSLPSSLLSDAEFLKPFPGGRAFFLYMPMILGSAGVVLGFSAQDFKGLGRRAGAVGVVAASLAILGVVLINLTRLGA